MNESLPVNTYFPPWEPKELGIPKAAAAALLLVAVIVAMFAFAYTSLKPKPVPPSIQVTQAQLTQLPRPTPPPPPKVIPPPKPMPAVIPKPLPVQSRIVVATKPPPPHIYKPIPHPIINHLPPPPTPAPPAVQPPAPAVPTSGIPIYGSAMHDILQANQNVPQALAALGISGTATVQITVAPDGHVISAKIVDSSGNPLIDQTVLDHALHGSYGAFNADMPSTPQTFTVPVEIDADSGN